MPLTCWNYTRNGIDITFDTSESVKNAMSSILKGWTGKEYTGKYDTAEFDSRMSAWVPSVKDYYINHIIAISPYECMSTLVPFFIDGSTAQLLSLIATVIADVNAWNAIYYFYDNSETIVYGHCQETYLCWLGAMYLEDVITGVTLTPLSGIYTGSPQKAVLIDGVYGTDEVTYSYDGKDFSSATPYITLAGNVCFYVRIRREGYEIWISDKKTATLAKASFDMSGVKSKTISFVYDGQSKIPSLLTGLPKGLKAIYSGTLTGKCRYLHNQYPMEIRFRKL
jgi:hypothetical protein